VAVLANINGPAPNAIAAKLATVAHGGTVQTTGERTEIALPSATLEKYVGTYQVASGVNMWIRLHDDHLTTRRDRHAVLLQGGRRDLGVSDRRTRRCDQRPPAPGPDQSGAGAEVAASRTGCSALTCGRLARSIAVSISGVS